MDLFTIIGAGFRRWYVTLPVLALAAVGAWFAYHAVAPEFSSSMSVAVLPAAPVPTPTDTATDPVGDNPYAGSGGARFAAAVLARNINTGVYRDSIGLKGHDDVTFTATASTQQPMIRIDATGPSPESVLDTLDRVAGRAGVVLDEFQVSAGASEETLYRLAVAVPSDTVSDVTPSRWRNAGALVALGLAVAAALATALDVALRRRGGRNAHGTGTDDRGPSWYPGGGRASTQDESGGDSRGGRLDVDPVVPPPASGGSRPMADAQETADVTDEGAGQAGVGRSVPTPDIDPAERVTFAPKRPARVGPRA